MIKAFEATGEQLPTVRWIGEVYEVDADDFTSVLRDDFLEGTDERVAIIPLRNIIEAELPRVISGALFYCDVAIIGEDEKVSIRSIEFDDELTETMHRNSLGVLAKTIAAAKERKFEHRLSSCTKCLLKAPCKAFLFAITTLSFYYEIKHKWEPADE